MDSIKEKEANNIDLAFGKKNYILLISAILIVILGFILMIGGGSKDPNVFNGEELFSFRRITLAPIIVMIGYILGIYAIMFKEKETNE